MSHFENEQSAVRMERDALGETSVPDSVYYGIQTQRALENFNITGVSIAHYPDLVTSLAMVKQAAVKANMELALIPTQVGVAIDQACQEIIEGRLREHFVVDLIQGGAGTSTNMNANEVIANRAAEILGGAKGKYTKVHPNNHVNCSQSTNDVYPTAVRLAIVFASKPLIAAIHALRDALNSKAEEFSNVLKLGRTQLQDAVPMSLGQEFNAFSITLFEDTERLQEVEKLLLEINLGGTAIGTGLNAHPDYAAIAIEHLSGIAGQRMIAASCKLEATSDMGAFMSYSAVLKRLAIKLSKIANDLRLMSSGPRSGFNEINLPAMQPGSSIMPGKVNPVIPEAMNQVAYQVVGNDMAVTMAAEAGQLQLNAMEPLIAHNILGSINMLTRSIEMLEQRCVRGISANVETCREHVEKSTSLATVLTPALGYDTASRVAQSALQTGRSVLEIVTDEQLLSGDQIDKALEQNI